MNLHSIAMNLVNARLIGLALLGPLLLIGCEQGYETVVVNRSSTSYVIRVEDHRGDRHYAAHPGRTVVVDDRGHNNPAAAAIVLLDASCAELAPVSGNFGKGGAITIDEHGGVSFEPDRPLPMGPRFLAGDDELTHARDTCQQAAGDLAQ